MKKKIKDKKKKVKMTVDGYYTDDNGFWTIYKTESGMTVMKKEKKSNDSWYRYNGNEKRLR